MVAVNPRYGAGIRERKYEIEVEFYLSQVLVDEGGL